MKEIILRKATTFSEVLKGSDPENSNLLFFGTNGIDLWVGKSGRPKLVIQVSNC